MTIIRQGHLFSTCGSYDQFFDPSHKALCGHVRIQSIPTFNKCDLIDLIAPSLVGLCSFTTVFSYCFTSEIQKFMTQLKQPISFFCRRYPPLPGISSSSQQPTSEELSINGGFKLFVILSFTIADYVKGELPF